MSVLPLLTALWLGAGPAPATVPTAGVSGEGRAITYQVIGEGAETVLFLATIHGDEHAGAGLLEELARHLRANPALLEGRRAVLVPVANPDGHTRKRRYNSRGVDLNRNFPSANWKRHRRSGGAPLSEPESRALQGLIDRYEPARIVSIHQPLAAIDYDGPARGLARAMARECRLRVRRLGSRPGSLGSYAGLTLGIAIVTLELRRRSHRVPARKLWRRYGAALVTALAYEAQPELLGTEIAWR